MAQPMQSQAAPKGFLEILHPDNAPIDESAACAQFPESDHLSDVMTTLEQEAFTGGADFVGK